MDLSKSSIVELKQAIQHAKGREFRALMEALAGDRRAGAQKLAKSAQARLDWKRRESVRLRRLMKYEADLANQGYRLIAGADEVGRGALAGPLVAAAVILKPKAKIIGINDSKKLTAGQREQLVEAIKSAAVDWAVAEISHEEIDNLGLQAANISALARAVEGLAPAPDFIICDGFKLQALAIPSMALIKGDSLSQTVAAASILAKVHRDKLMVDRHRDHPIYGFNINKGYATSDHIEAIKKTGPCALHRRSFFPVCDYGRDQLCLEAERPIIQNHGIEKV